MRLRVFLPSGILPLFLRSACLLKLLLDPAIGRDTGNPRLVILNPTLLEPISNSAQPPKLCYPFRMNLAQAPFLMFLLQTRPPGCPIFPFVPILLILIRFAKNRFFPLLRSIPKEPSKDLKAPRPLFSWLSPFDLCFGYDFVLRDSES